MTVLLTMEYDFTGVQTIAVLVDSQQNVAESNEVNNVLTQRLFVLSLGVDIAVVGTIDNVTGTAYPAMVSFVPSATINAGVLGATETGNTVTITTTMMAHKLTIARSRS